MALLVPGILVFVALAGLFRGTDVYAALLRGAEEGLKTALKLAPTLVVLMTAVTMLRASGTLELLEEWLKPVLTALGIPPEMLPLMLVRPVSGSAALGVGAELIASHGPDSLVGRTASVMLGSTETTFYTLAVYLGTAGVTRSRYALPAALCADLAGFLASAWTVRLLFGP